MNSLSPDQSKSERLISMDAYRGTVMFLMVAEMLRLSQLAEVYPESSFWQWIKFHTTHVEWVGISLHDMIQPSFSFLVGTAMAYSLAKRTQRGDSYTKSLLHAAWRALVLILLGVFLRSLGKPQTNWTFTDTLSQIGFGYLPLFVIATSPRWLQVITMIGILVGSWWAYAQYPLPPADFDYASVSADSRHLFEGFLAHWNKNSNFGWGFDRWFLNLFPQPKPFEFNAGGYSTINFVPTLATMLMGFWGGSVLLRLSNARSRIGALVAFGIAILAIGIGLHYAGACPIVKRIWTPAFALASGGICALWLAAYYLIIDVLGWRRWAFPFVVIGTNSIAIYVMDWTMEKGTFAAIDRHFGSTLREYFPTGAEATMHVMVMLVFWLILYWMYRHKVFVKI